MKRRSLSIGVAIAALGAVAACGRVEPKLEGCVPVAPGVVHDLQKRVEAGGTLRNVFQYTEASSGIVFISGELHLDEDDADDKGEILTWATPRGSERLVAVDEHARDEPAFPAADFDVRKEGAVQSRGCTFNVLGRSG